LPRGTSMRRHHNVFRSPALPPSARAAVSRRQVGRHRVRLPRSPGPAFGRPCHLDQTDAKAALSQGRPILDTAVQEAIIFMEHDASAAGVLTVWRLPIAAILAANERGKSVAPRHAGQTLTLSDNARPRRRCCQPRRRPVAAGRG
jgi:hypothetical protein